MARLRQQWRKGDRFLARHVDEAIVVVEKRAGLLTVRKPTGGENLVDLVRDFLTREPPRAHAWAAHRLDQNVSGLLVLARTEAAKEDLIEQFRARRVDRFYLAAVEGLLPDDEGRLESAFREDPRSLRMVPDPRGRLAITYYRVIERLRAATLVEARLETGLKNQIRAQFAEIGFPLLGERKYLPPGRKGASSVQGKSRVFLHAAHLGFEHPRSGRWMEFDSPLPSELIGWKRKL